MQSSLSSCSFVPNKWSKTCTAAAGFRMSTLLIAHIFVIIVDDGVATGMTAVAAVQDARLRGRLLMWLTAVPVMSLQSYHESCSALRQP